MVLSVIALFVVYIYVDYDILFCSVLELCVPDATNKLTGCDSKPYSALKTVGR